MGIFSDVLLTADYDRTITAPDSSVPPVNVEAIRYFMENGGAFTINTGRSLAMTRHCVESVPVNAPLLLYNGGAAYDLEKEEFVFCHLIDLDLEETVRQAMTDYPGLVVEIQGANAHYVYKENPMWEAYYRRNPCQTKVAAFGDDVGPFIKMCIFGPLENDTVSHLFEDPGKLHTVCDAAEADLHRRYDNKMNIMRVAPRIIDIHAPGISKGKSARQLQKAMGRKILVCIGDAENDISMLEDADFSFCPADGRVANQFPNVCSCAEGAVADVIYKKIPEILGIKA